MDNTFGLIILTIVVYCTIRKYVLSIVTLSIIQLSIVTLSIIQLSIVLSLAPNYNKI